MRGNWGQGQTIEGMGVGHGGRTHNKKALYMLCQPFKIHCQSSFVRNALQELGNSTMFVVRILFNSAAFGISLLKNLRKCTLRMR